ncbi:MAG: hypothetical protein GQ507_02910 [Dehalococcoidales bacterium]|nr:hypothetical protein [Dehalococcoidales bacterium]
MGDIKITYPLFNVPSSPCYRAHVETDDPYALVKTLRIIAAFRAALDNVMKFDGVVRTLDYERKRKPKRRLER